jgi:hypothetical protein
MNESTLKAFRVDWGYPEKVIVAALTHSKAKSLVVNSLLEADYASCWLDALYRIKSCKRAPEFDWWALEVTCPRSREEKDLARPRRRISFGIASE